MIFHHRKSWLRLFSKNKLWRVYECDSSECDFEFEREPIRVCGRNAHESGHARTPPQIERHDGHTHTPESEVCKHRESGLQLISTYLCKHWVDQISRRRTNYVAIVVVSEFSFNRKMWFFFEALNMLIENRLILKRRNGKNRKHGRFLMETFHGNRVC